MKFQLNVLHISVGANQDSVEYHAGIFTHINSPGTFLKECKWNSYYDIRKKQRYWSGIWQSDDYKEKDGKHLIVTLHKYYFSSLEDLNSANDAITSARLTDIGSWIQKSISCSWKGKVRKKDDYYTGKYYQYLNR
jgi:hypothetical protein